MAKEPKFPALSDADLAALESLYELHYKAVVYFFIRVGFPTDTARELAQETFLRAGRGWTEFRGEASRGTWLTEIARNLLKNRFRDLKALKNWHIEVPLDTSYPDAETEVPQGLQVADPSPLAPESLLTAERNQQLREAIAQLPPQRRQCVELRLQDLQYSEIAAIMGLSIETIKSHLYQAREALRQMLSALE